MIIKKIFNSVPFSFQIPKRFFKSSKTYLFSTQITDKSINQSQLLEQVLSDVKLLKKSSIMLQEADEMQRRKKLSLTKQDKQKLGLYVPKMALNPRMGVQSQTAYRQKICQNLYELQKANLQTRVRIMQKLTDSQNFTMDKYINTVYKDIYARFMISKGIGVQWQGRYSTYGLMNSTSLPSSPTDLVTNFLKANIHSIKEVQSIAPYSYLEQKFIPTQLIEVQNIRKIGYYLRLPLIEFGRHEQSFNKLNEMGSTVELLVFCEYLEKLINPQSLCVMKGQKFIIMKRHFIQKTQVDSSKIYTPKQSNLKYEYLITSLQIFNKHKEYFQKKNYEKHSIFESQHLVGMKAEYSFNVSSGKGSQNNTQTKLEIIEEIEGYERNPGVYVVNGATSIPDYQRVQEMNQVSLSQIKNVLDQSGKLFVGQNGSATNPLSIIDLQFQEKLLQNLKSTLQFQQLYDVFEDQVYSNKLTSEVLRFRLFPKLQIPISSVSYQKLQSYLSARSQQITIHESKVKLPQNKKFSKPRDRRNHRKQVKEALKQRTDYMTLMESIKSIDNIPVSSSVPGDLKLYIEKDQNGNIVNVHQKEFIQSKTQTVTVSTDLISALAYLYNSNNLNPTSLSSILIEPQTFTEQILPLSLHLTLFSLKPQPKKQGRRQQKHQQQINHMLESIKLIYLHPTMKPSQRQLQVNSFISGSMKISTKKDYGYGFQAIRLWVCRHSEYLGDRQLKEKQVNEEIKNAAFIRKFYSQILPLMPKAQSSISIPYEQLNFLDRFILTQINAYILNMEQFYSQLNLKAAYEYTMDFYKNVLEEIYLTTIRKHVIAFPNDKDNLGHAVTIRRILELLAILSPLFPFSAYHISKTDIMKWPRVDEHDNQWYKNLMEYNALIKIRTQLRNKLLLNNFTHCQVTFPISDQLLYTPQDLKKFLGVDKISFKQPEVKEKNFGFKLRHNQTIGGKSKIQVFESKDHCIRCDPDSKQKQHLCTSCLTYMETNVGKEIEFYDQRNNSVYIPTNKEQSNQQKIQIAKQ